MRNNHSFRVATENELVMKLLVRGREAKGNDEHHPSSTETGERGQSPGSKGLSATASCVIKQTSVSVPLNF
jgi:hypothetical protein